MTEQISGLPDIPILDVNDESLGLEEYAIALKEFVSQCDTPMTVALQGDWGTGKTSLMNFIKQKVNEDQEYPKIKTVWFNTWQYSQFAMSETLTLSLLSRFTDELASGANRTKVKNILTNLRQLCWAGALGAVAKATSDKTADRVAEAFSPKQDNDFAKEIEELKSVLKEIVVQHDGVDRFVIFVDDLDRLIPSKAVELLECLKLFLDIEKCVYILACDYQVVIQGYQQKFNATESELRGRSFFDKIIQLPFDMPITHYRVRDYMTEMLNRINVQYSEDDVTDYIDLVRHSAGLNPRAIKRLFNSLQLISFVVINNELLTSAMESVGARGSKVSKILFAILCLQHFYKPVYRFLTESKDVSDNLLRRLYDEKALLNESEFDGLRSEFNVVDEDAFFDKLATFNYAFYKSLHFTIDARDVESQPLSNNELEAFKTALMFSPQISIDYSDRYKNRSVAKELSVRLNDIYAAALSDIPEGSVSDKGFRIYQIRSTKSVYVEVYIFVKALDFYVGLCFEHNSTYGCLYCQRKSSLRASSKWAGANLENVFPNYQDFSDNRRDELWWFARLFEMNFDAGTEWDQKAESYRELSLEAMSTLMPILLSSLSSQDEKM